MWFLIVICISYWICMCVCVHLFVSWKTSIYLSSGTSSKSNLYQNDGKKKINKLYQIRIFVIEKHCLSFNVSPFVRNDMMNHLFTLNEYENMSKIINTTNEIFIDTDRECMDCLVRPFDTISDAHIVCFQWKQKVSFRWEDTHYCFHQYEYSISQELFLTWRNETSFAWNDTHHWLNHGGDSNLRET